MEWYNWVGAVIFMMNFTGLQSWLWKKLEGKELTRFESAVLGGIAVILFVINR